MRLSGLFQHEKQTNRNDISTRTFAIRKHYDFSNSQPNLYAQKLKKQITIRIDEDTIAYFKNTADEKGIPYQGLINLYLRDCAQSQRDLKLQWQ